MAAFDKYIVRDFTDGDTAVPLSAANMDEISRICDIADSELGRSQYYRFRDYKQYYYDRNVKDIELFQDYSSFSGLSGGETLASDTTNKFIGAEGVRCTEDDDVAGWIGITKSISSLDLTEFNDGGASGVNDLIAFGFYIDDYTKLSTITIKLGDDNSNNFSYTVFASSLGDGYQTLYVRKSEFTENGTPAGWDDITYINCQSYTETNGSGGYFTSLILQLIREDPEFEYYANPFQVYRGATTEWENLFTQEYDLWQIYNDPVISKLGIGKVNESNHSDNEATLHLLCDVINFIGKFEMYCKDAGELSSVTWKYSDDDYFETFIQLDTFYLIVREDGSNTIYSVALDNSLLYNERVNLYLEKQGEYIRAILKKDGEEIKTLEHESTYTYNWSGCVYFGNYSDTGHSFITDWLFTNTQTAQLDSWDGKKYLKNETVEQSTTSASYTTIDDLDLYLPPNQSFEIIWNFVYNAADEAVDMITNFAVTGDVELVGEFGVQGMAYSSTNPAQAEEMKTAAYDNLTDSVILGADPSPCYARYNIIVKTGQAGGLFQFKFKQRNADAGNPLYARAGTYATAEILNK